MATGRFGQPLTVAGVLAGDRHQRFHRRVGRNLASTDPVLNTLRQHTDQRQAARHPTRTLLEPASQLFVIQAETHQMHQQPSLLQGCVRLRRPQATLEHQRLCLRHIPHRGAHRVLAQPDQRPQSLEAVDHQEASRLGRSHHHDRYLLTLVRQRRQHAALDLGTTQTQRLVAGVESVKFHIHRSLQVRQTPH